MAAAMLGAGMAAEDPGRALTEADALFNEQRYAEAKSQYEKAFTQAGVGPDRRVQVEAASQVARCCSLLKETTEGKAWLDKAKGLATPEEPQGWSRYLGVRGIFEREAGERDHAKATFEEMHEYCKTKGLHRRAVDAIHHIAILVPPEEQPAWALKGIAAAEAAKDEAWLAVLWNNLGCTYEDLKQHDRMLEAYLKARDYHHRASPPPTADDGRLGRRARLQAGREAREGRRGAAQGPA